MDKEIEQRIDDIYVQLVELAKVLKEDGTNFLELDLRFGKMRIDLK